MKTKIFFFILVCQSMIGQIKLGNYKIISDSLRTPSISFQNDGSFIYQNNDAMSCHAWTKINGKWKTSLDKVTLEDSVLVHNRDFTKGKKLRRVTVYYVKNDELIFHNQNIEKLESDYSYSTFFSGDFRFKQ